MTTRKVVRKGRQARRSQKLTTAAAKIATKLAITIDAKRKELGELVVASRWQKG